MSRFAPLRPVILLVAVVALVAACSGSATPSPSATTSMAPESALPASPQASATAPGSMPSATDNGSPAASPAGSPAAAIPSFDLSTLGGAIPGLDSYRTSLSTGGVMQYQTTVVTKPTLAQATTVYDSSGAVQTRIVVIGDKAWTADGTDGAFTAVPDTAATAMLAAFNPSMLLKAYSSLDWATMGASQGADTKNGISSQHLHLDSASALGLAAALPSGAAIDIWVADAGYLVAWEMTGFPSEQNVSIETTNVNDPANVVTAPAS